MVKTFNETTDIALPSGRLSVPVAMATFQKTAVLLEEFFILGTHSGKRGKYLVSYLLLMDIVDSIQHDTWWRRDVLQ